VLASVPTWDYWHRPTRFREGVSLQLLKVTLHYDLQLLSQSINQSSKAALFCSQLYLVHLDWLFVRFTC
jgi:hypothetical protein